MKEFIRKHYDHIHGVLSCFDRMLFRGDLPALIWKIMMVAETTFHRLNAVHVLKDVYQRAKYINGVRIQDQLLRDAPELIHRAY